MNPYVEYCFNRLGLEYSPERCDDTCDYARTIKALKDALKYQKSLNKRLDEILEKLEN